MEHKTKVTVVVNIIGTILLAYALYVLTNSYLQYSTITKVGIVRYRNELPEMEDLFCYLVKPNQIPQLSLNGRKVEISKFEFVISNGICHTLNFSGVESNMVEQQIFILDDKNDVGLTYMILRNLKKMARYQPANLVNFFSRARGYLQTPEMMTIHLLQAPYDTNCKNYPISAFTTFKACLKKAMFSSQSAMALKGCLRDWLQDCEQILFHLIFQTSPSPESYVAIFASHPVEFKADIAIPMSFYVQQIFGLISTFIEAGIMDVKDFIVVSTLWLFTCLKKRSKKPCVRKCVRKLRKICKFCIPKLLLSGIIIGCIFELHRTISGYMRYQIDTETYLGKPSIQYLPTIGICSKLLTEKGGRAGTSFDSKSMNISFMSQAAEGDMVEYYIDGSKCYSITPQISEVFDLSTRDIVTMSFSENFPVEVYEDYFNKIPRSNPSILLGSSIQVRFATMVTQQHSLQAPYKSACINYGNYGHESRQHCIDRCIIDEYKEQYKMFPAKIPHTELIIHPLSNKSIDSVYSCNIICRHDDCMYRLFHTTEFLEISFSRAKVIKLARHEQLLSIKLSPKQSLSEFATYTASLISLWLGFTFASFVSPVISAIKLFDVKEALASQSSKLLYFILMTLLIVHSYTLIDNYLRYPIVSVVNVMGEETTHLPSVSIAFSLNNRTKNSNATLYSNMTMMEKSAKDMNQFFKPFDQIVGSVHLESKNLKGHIGYTAHNMSEYIATFAYKDRKVITLRLGDISPDEYVYNRQQIMSVRNQFEVQFKGAIRFAYEIKEGIKESSVASVMIHSGEYADADTKSSIRLRDFAALVYLSSELKLLKYPYQSNCIDYINPLKTNQSVIGCILQQHRMKYGKIPYDLTIPTNYTEERMERDREISGKCGEVYGFRPYCQSIDYKSNLMHRTSFMTGDIYAKPHTRQTVCTYVPKMFILDLALLLAESFDIWLGISLCWLMRKTYQGFHSLKVPKCCNKPKIPAQEMTPVRLFSLD